MLINKLIYIFGDHSEAAPIFVIVDLIREEVLDIVPNKPWNIIVDCVEKREYRYKYYLDIIDIQNSVLLDLPEVNDIRMLLATKAVKENVGEYDKYVIQLTDVSDNIAKFRFAFSNPNFPDQISGRYSYDIERSVITDFYVVSENISDWMIP